MYAINHHLMIEPNERCSFLPVEVLDTLLLAFSWVSFKR
jgi:hypothetical protein